MKLKNAFLGSLLGALMCLVLCGCPVVHQNDLGPVGYLVKMETDYSHNIMALKFSDHDYWVKCGYSHTTPLTNNYYYITENYVSVVYTVWNESECNDSISSMFDIEDYIANDNPFLDVYELNKEESLSNLIKRVENNDFNGLEKVK